MKSFPKFLKITLITANVLIICIFAYWGIMYLFNILLNYKLATTNNFISFFGGIVGSLISALIAIIALVYTISNGNKNQKQVSNLQSALQVENNMTLRMEKAREVLTETINQLDVLLLMVKHLKLSGNDYSAERRSIVEIYTTFRKAINAVRLNTEIYFDLSRCEGCTDCDIKSYGEFVKRTMELQKCFIEIDQDCSYAISELIDALDISMDAHNLVANQTNVHSVKIQTERLIKMTNEQLGSADEIQKQSILFNLDNLERDLNFHNNEIETMRKTINAYTEAIGIKNKNAREMAVKIEIGNKGPLDNAVYKYFELYKLYIAESRAITSKSGRLSKGHCKKYNFSHLNDKE